MEKYATKTIKYINNGIYSQSMKIDETDKKILNALQSHADMTIAQLGRKLALPLTTVHNRIKKLTQGRIIKKYTVILDYEKLGKGIAAYVLITVDYTKLQERGITQSQLAVQLRKNPCVEEISMITGNHDILLKVRVGNVTELNTFVTDDLRTIEGIEKTQTLLILQEIF